MFYQTVVESIIEQLKRKRKPQQTSEPTSDEFRFSLLSFLAGYKGDIDYAAGVIANLGLLVAGGRQTLSLENKSALVNIRLDNATLNAILGIYRGYLGENTIGIMKNELVLAFNLYKKVTGSEDLSDFVECCNTAYGEALDKYPELESPKENPGLFFLKMIQRQRMDKTILEIEDKFVNTTLEECLSKIENGDLTAYTLPTVLELGRRDLSAFEAESGKPINRMIQNIELIGNLTELPTVKTVNAGKSSFINTFEYKKATPEQIKTAATQGLNVWLTALKEYHEEMLEKGWYMITDLVPYYGKQGILFCPANDIHIVPMRDEFRKIMYGDGTGIGVKIDENKHYSNIGAAEKVHKIVSDWVDWQRIEPTVRKWYETAINEVVAGEINELKSLLKKNGEILEHLYYRHAPVASVSKNFIRPELYDEYRGLAKHIPSK